MSPARRGPGNPGGVPRSVRTPDTSAAGRLQRLLALVPWVLDHPGATVDEVCERFEMTRETLIADLELLYVTGVPPYGPGDLMEAWVDGDKVHIGFADWFARAPRLTWREAAGLYLAGRALDSLPEVAEQGALARALAKLEAVLPADQLGRVHELAGKVSVDLEGDPAETSARTELARAAATGHRVEIEYWSASRGELTRRKVDPWLVFSASGHWYLSGWCHKAVAERLFRVDRVVSVRPTDEPFQRPAGFDPAAHGELGGAELFAGGLECELDLGHEAEWVVDYFPILGSERRPDGRLRVRLATHQLSWLVRLVLRLAPEAEPVSPPELRSAVAEATRMALAAYSA
jgi:proteasome accessory factor C